MRPRNTYSENRFGPTTCQVKQRAGRVLAILALVTSVGVADEPPTTFQPIAPGVTAALQPAANWINDSNSAVIVGQDTVAVIDAPADPDTVRRILAEITQLTDLPVRYLINTHWHSDHTQGNQLYREHYGERLVIVGHETLRSDVPTRAGGYIEEQRERLAEIIPRAEEQLAQGLSLGGEPLDAEQKIQQREGIAQASQQLAIYENAKLLPPDLTYSERLTLHLGGLEVRLIHFRAHTEGDTVIYLPDQRVLFTGDLLDVLPFAGHGYLESWIAALDELTKLEIETIVPGHGPVFEGKAQLLLLRDYFDAIVVAVRAALARGDSLEQTQASVDLSRFRTELAGNDVALQRNFDTFAPEAIARTYSEFSGEASPDPESAIP